MDETTPPPKRTITHMDTGTTAQVVIWPKVRENLLGEDRQLRSGAEDHVAIAFKRTAPTRGPSMRNVRHVHYDRLRIIPPIDEPDEIEPFVPMDHHGDPLDLDAE